MQTVQYNFRKFSRNGACVQVLKNKLRKVYLRYNATYTMKQLSKRNFAEVCRCKRAFRPSTWNQQNVAERHKPVKPQVEKYGQLNTPCFLIVPRVVKRVNAINILISLVLELTRLLVIRWSLLLRRDACLAIPWTTSTLQHARTVRPRIDLLEEDSWFEDQQSLPSYRESTRRDGWPIRNPRRRSEPPCRDTPWPLKTTTTKSDWASLIFI